MKWIEEKRRGTRCSVYQNEWSNGKEVVEKKKKKIFPPLVDLVARGTIVGESHHHKSLKYNEVFWDVNQNHFAKALQKCNFGRKLFAIYLFILSFPSPFIRFTSTQKYVKIQKCKNSISCQKTYKQTNNKTKHRRSRKEKNSISFANSFQLH